MRDDSRDPGAGRPGEEPLRAVERSDAELPAKDLRWRCDPSWLPFDSIREVEPARGIVGQEDAIASLRFGLECRGSGQQIYVRGLAGTGRMTLVQQMIADLRPECPEAHDRCYVHDFEQPDRPRLITLAAGRALPFARSMEGLIRFIAEDLPPILASDEVRAARRRLDDAAEAKMRRIGEPLDKEMQDAGLALVPVQVGQTVHPAVLPVIGGTPVPLEKVAQLKAEGKLDEEEADALLEEAAAYARRFEDASETIREIQGEHREQLRELLSTRARAALEAETARITDEFPEPEVRRFLAHVVDDFVDTRLGHITQADRDFTRLYRVNPIVSRDASDACPVIIERSPSLRDLLGHVERELVGAMTTASDHLMIRAGALLRADGGFLVLEARDVLSEPGAWRGLLRTLRTGILEIGADDGFGPFAGPSLRPEPVKLDVKVVLIGDPGLYYLLDAHDPDFPELFKVLVDFDSSIPRTKESASAYAAWLARRVEQESLRPFTRDAVVALVEHGARIAAHQDRLTAQFGRVADIAREASHVACREKSDTVDSRHVRLAITENKRRADLPARSFRRLVREGKIRVVVDGERVGQVNGLAVIRAGPLTYGFPSRITATIGAGTAGTINIERESQLSGAIHTKAFYILGGLLRHLLPVEHPLAFSASIAFEQSYGGIDGDSASGAEICCLLSALTGVPIRQELAMTGAIDQHGAILPVGAVTEKIEGFFDACTDLGLTGRQGVVIPRANAGDLMLRHDVVEACEAGTFRVYAVDTIREALEALTGFAAGTPGEDGAYPADTLLGRAVACASLYWKRASGRRRPRGDRPDTNDDA